MTVLSTQDPVRVYTEFATLDAVSNGRAQLIVGRGSLTDSFPLFGFDLADYETLFEEKLDLLTRLLRDQPVTWSGTSRPPLTDQYVSPPLPAGHLPTWVGVGGSPQSVVRAARYGLPLMLAIIGGHPSRFAPYVELYQRALDEYGHPPLPVGMHSLGFVAKTDEEAVDVAVAALARDARCGIAPSAAGPARPGARSRPRSPTDPSTSAHPKPSRPSWPRPSACSGSADSTWPTPSERVPHEQRMATIDLYGREVIPRVRQLLEEPALHPAPSEHAANIAGSRA